MAPILKSSTVCILAFCIAACLSGSAPSNNDISTHNTASYTAHIKDFEYIKYSGNVTVKGEKKDIYRHKRTGKQWMLSESFGKYEFSSYVAGGLYQLMLQDRVPNIALIKKDDGTYTLGSEFIQDFQNMGEFFGEQDKDLIAHSYQASLTGAESLPPLNDEQVAIMKEQITGIEDVLAAAIILGDNDLHKKNMGVIPSKTHPGKYQIAKVDHDMSFYLIQYLNTLGQQKLPVFEIIVFNPEIIDLNNLSLAFEKIANIDDKLWKQSIKERLSDLKKSGQFDEATFHIYEHARWWKGEVFEGDRDILTIMMERKQKAGHYAKSLKAEACIRSGDLPELKAMIQNGEISIDEKHESLFLEEALGWPIPLSEMAKAYNQEEIAAYLLPLVQSNTNEQDLAINALPKDIL